MAREDSDSVSSHGGSESPSSVTTKSSRNGRGRSPHVKNNNNNNASNNNSTSSSRRHSKDLPATKIIQITNIAPQAKREEIQTLFAFIGKIDDVRLYPTIDLGMTVGSKICFVKFHDGNSVLTSQHLTNTVFIDRALIVVPFMENEIPDEQRGLELLCSGTLLPGIADPKLPQHVTSQLEGIPPNQVVATHDPKLIEGGLPIYPHLPPALDTRRIEEIRRTILIANLDPQMTSEQVADYFSKAGEVKYFRFCTRDNDPLQYGLLEFSEQPSILEALKLNGTLFGTKVLKVYHATQAIVKPQAKTNEAAQKEIEDAVSRQSFSLDNSTPTHSTQHMGAVRPDKLRARSRSRDRRSPRSRSRDRRRRSHSRDSRNRKRSGSRTSSHRRRSRSRKRTKRSKSRSRDRDRERARRSRSRKRSRSSHGRHRKSGSRSKDRDRSSKKKDKKDKDRERDRGDRDRSDRKDRDKDKDRGDRGERTTTTDKEKDRKEEIVNGIKDED